MDCFQGITNPCPNTLEGPATQLFLTLINSLMVAQCSLGPEGRYPPDYGQHLKDGDEFDFIVVGTGSAGSIVASRLSDIEDWKILVLEAGSYPSPLSEVPGLWARVQDTDEDWKYKMQPSKTCCLGLNGQVCRCPRGKALGGTSTMNGMLYLRGHRTDYDSWAEAGNPGWDYDSVINYFKKFEDVEGEYDPKYGKGGDLGISRYTSSQPIRGLLEGGYRQLGYSDYEEGTKPLGFFDCYLSVATGTRSNTGKAFLGKVKDRKNLHVAVNAEVAKLLINEGTNGVKGVEVRVNNKLIKIKSRKEVILSAGSINSPKILMNSGVGPKNHLESLGIKVYKDLPVGQNLQDHSLYTAFFVNVDKSAVMSTSSAKKLDDLYDFLMHRKGPLTQQGILNFQSFVNVKDDSKLPNIQYVHMLYNQNDPYSLSLSSSRWNLPEEIIDAQLNHNKNSNNLLIAPILSKPKSNGQILLRSADPFDVPLIFPNYFSDPNEEDLEIMVKGIQFLEKLIKTEPLLSCNAQLIDFEIRNCKKFVQGTEDYWKCAVRNLAATLYQPVGTCKMGPAKDTTSVVDPRLRVHGIKGVRVMDGSIMPTITSCNVNGPIMMIGEKGAELVKQDWLQTRDEL